MKASLELLENLPQKDLGLRLGELKPLSLWPMAKRVEEVKLLLTDWLEVVLMEEKTPSES